MKRKTNKNGGSSSLVSVFLFCIVFIAVLWLGLCVVWPLNHHHEAWLVLLVLCLQCLGLYFLLGI